MTQERKATAAPQQQVLLVDFAAQGRQQFQQEMEHFRKHPLDRAPRRGGYFLNFDGSGAHDANGNPVPLRSEDREQASEQRRASTFNRGGGEGNDVETTGPASEAGTIAPSPQAIGDTGVRMVTEETQATAAASTRKAGRPRKAKKEKKARKPRKEKATDSTTVVE